MERVARWDAADRRDLIQETASRKGLHPAVIEKDFWVCWTLGRLFTSPELADKLLFKGGTTLSKIFKLIDRFSEDVDLILKLDQIDENDLVDDRSRTGQKRFLDRIRENATDYVHKTTLPRLSERTGDFCEVSAGDVTEPRVLYLEYPASFSADYIPPRIKLEIGPVALWTPNALHIIQPYIAEEFPDQFENPACQVQAVSAERTFWEKATILHAQAGLPEDTPLRARYSRHYYDLFRMADTAIGASALGDLGLLKSVAKFKDKCYHSGWANYKFAKPGTFRLIPPARVERELRRDYAEMQVMIYGEVPLFDQILDRLAALEKEINSLEPH